MPEFNLEPGGCACNRMWGGSTCSLTASNRVAEPQKCLVVGAGPAGLAAARMLALRGHTVTVCDQQADVGGALRLASKPPGRAELMDILNDFVEELIRLKVDVSLEQPGC